MAYWVSFVLIAATMAVYVMDSSLFEGLLPKVMEQLSLFSRFTVVVNGVFDLTAIVYYLTVLGFFCSCRFSPWRNGGITDEKAGISQETCSAVDRRIAFQAAPMP